MGRGEGGLRYRIPAAWMLAYGAAIVGIPAILRLVIRDSTSPAQYGSGFYWFFLLAIIPCLAIGFLLGVVGSTGWRLMRRNSVPRARWARAVAVGLIAGLLGAYPLGFFVSSPQIPIDLWVATLASGGYLGVTFGLFVFFGERRALRESAAPSTPSN